MRRYSSVTDFWTADLRVPSTNLDAPYAKVCVVLFDWKPIFYLKIDGKSYNRLNWFGLALHKIRMTPTQPSYLESDAIPFRHGCLQQNTTSNHQQLISPLKIELCNLAERYKALVKYQPLRVRISLIPNCGFGFIVVQGLFFKCY